MSQPASAAPSRKKTVISLLVLAALTGIIVLLFRHFERRLPSRVA